MRCRFCNKAISLLRRLNDAEYCTDAHRFADQGEQQLAMQRLAETQPALLRTQRMAAAKPGNSVPSEDATRADTMTAFGAHLPFSPPVIQSGWQPKAVRDPLHIASTVLFKDRHHRYLGAMPWGANSFPVPMAAAAPTRLPAAVLGQLAQARIVTPRGLILHLQQGETWSATPAIILFALSLEAKETQIPESPAPRPEPVFELKWLRHPHRRRDRELKATNKLSGLSMFPAGLTARPIGGKPSGDPFFQPPKACIPLSRLAAVAPPAPVRKEDGEERWTLLEASPLGALLSVTPYPAVSVGAERIVSGTPEPVAFPALAPRAPNTLPSFGFHQPDTIFGLREIGAPSFVSLLIQRTSSNTALEILIAPQPPEHRANPSSRAMETTRTVLPVFPPAVAVGLNLTAPPAAAEHESAFPPHAARQPQSKTSPLALLSLHRSERVLAVAPPESAPGRQASLWDRAWVPPRLTERLPAARFAVQSLSLAAAPGGPIPMPEAAGARALPNVSEAWFPALGAIRTPAIRAAMGIQTIPSLIVAPPGLIPEPDAAGARALPNLSEAWFPAVVATRPPARRAASGIQTTPSLLDAPPGLIPEPDAAGARALPNVSEAWFPAVVAMRPPASRVLTCGNGIPMGSPVACDLQPDSVASVRRPYFQQTLQTMVGVRPPRYSQRLVSRYGSAECVPLSPPATQILPWNAAIVNGTDLSPNLVFPLRAKPWQNKALRQIPVRLFPVPRAKPAARPGGGRPRVIGMDLWASPPAIGAPRIPFDDGKPRVKHVSTQRLAQQLRERFSSEGLRGAWTKVSRLPSDLKWIAMVVPLILGIWVVARPASSEPASSQISASRERAAAAEPASPPEPESRAAVTPVSPPPVREMTPPARPGPAPAGEPTRWEILSARIASRASVDLIEDFHNGLSQWEGRGEWARTWSYDRSGTVRPGQMAIFQPTIALKDYTVEMKASIERRSIQWVVRASGPQNYHFASLNVTPGAPLTKLEFERWSVINGRTGRVTRLPLPHGGANQTLYSIRVEVKGDSITTYLQDQVIDTFSDPRLPVGGIGLVGAHEDRARIYGLHVSHQNDFWGKLCSFLAPPPINNQGSD